MTTTTGVVPARHEVPLEQRWDQESVIPTDEAWEAAFPAAEERLPEQERDRGRLGESAATLLAALRLQDAIAEQVGRVVVYADLRRSEDATNPAYAALADRARGLQTRFAAARAFFESEMLAIPSSKRRPSSRRNRAWHRTGTSLSGSSAGAIMSGQPRSRRY